MVTNSCGRNVCTIVSSSAFVDFMSAVVLYLNYSVLNLHNVKDCAVVLLHFAKHYLMGQCWSSVHHLYLYFTPLHFCDRERSVSCERVVVAKHEEAAVVDQSFADDCHLVFGSALNLPYCQKHFL